MKRLFLFTMLLTTVFGFSRLNAQSTPPVKDSRTISLEFSAPAPREQVLIAVAKGSVFNIVFDDPVPGEWSGKLTDVTVAQAIRQLLPDGYEMFTDEDLVIHVRKIRNTQMAYPPQLAQTMASNPNFAPIIPSVYGNNLNALSLQAVANARTMAEANAALAQLSLNEVRYPSYYPGQYSSSYSSYDYALWPWMRGCQSGPAGYIQFDFDGSRDERKLWQIYLNGERPGSVTQGDRFWRKIPVCAGSVQVEIRKLGLKTNVIGSHQDLYSVRPGATTKINVGNYLFDLDSHQELKKRVLVER